ncbi:MAG: hypothetical protein JWM80_741 [Cyanobacteria bacterium RYN_339]|nr:hypothetical protein [Cyanobacteria bacterium RYN_339]
MLFQSAVFVWFLVLTLAAYWTFPRARLPLLAVANATFYVAAGWQNLSLFLAASLATYGIGRHVDGPRGRAWVALGITANVANLAWFKYAGFLASNLPAWLPWGGLVPVLLPIGISFYTFQHISYLVDRRQRGLPNAPNYLHFWVYIAFFGHSIAGPIMRGHEFFPQIAATPALRFDAERARVGLELFLLGLAKKLLVADQVVSLVDGLFGRVWTLGAQDAWLAATLFAFQIYYDFSAYSDMAVGIGHMFGFTLTQNFRTPYVAAGPGEFWQRWHITLSAWIRDYVYIPLGGNRAGVARGQLNLFIAMLASGLWHGANWTFVLWGAYHGALLLGQRGWRGLLGRLGWRPAGRAYHLLAVGAFFLLTVIGWVPFRAPGLEEALWMLGSMAGFHGAGNPVGWRLGALVAGLMLLHLGEYALRERLAGFRALWRTRPPAVALGTAYALAACCLMGASDGVKAFIYFRF